jgi:hypothetical protein
VATILGLIAAFFPAGPSLPGVSASGPTPITDCADSGGLLAAIAAGGQYVFNCSGTIQAHDMVVSNAVSLDATGHTVTIDAQDQGRVFDLTGGTLTLTGLTLKNGSVTGSPSNFATSGQDGTSGQVGAHGASPPSSNGGPGGNGTAGSDGGPGQSGMSAQGGEIYLAPGATLNLNGDTLQSGFASGEVGGMGGGGGEGGIGGDGGDGGCELIGQDCHFLPAGAGGNGGASGSGAKGGDGGAGQGGAIYVSPGATLDAQGSTFSNNSAYGGFTQGGGCIVNEFGVCLPPAANPGGGIGGEGSAPWPPGGSGGSGGNGGDDGNGGAAQGGAIFNAGTAILSGDTFIVNQAVGGDDAGGSAGEYGGTGGQGGLDILAPEYGPGGSGAPGGNGGNGGKGGDAQGGAVYNSGRLTLTGVTFQNNEAIAAPGGNGGAGGNGGSGGFGGPDGNGANGGNGGHGGNGGNAQGGAIYPAAVTGSAVTASGDLVIAKPGGAAGAAGAGGSGTNSGSNGTAGTAGAAGIASGAEPTVTCGTNTASEQTRAAVRPDNPGSPSCALLHVEVQLTPNPVKAGMTFGNRGAGFYQCASGCSVVTVTVTNAQTGVPVAGARVNVSADYLVGDPVVTPDQGGGYFCTKYDCTSVGSREGNPINGTTDDSGQLKLLYWMPGVHLEASTKVTATADSVDPSTNAVLHGVGSTTLTIQPHLIYENAIFASERLLASLKTHWWLHNGIGRLALAGDALLVLDFTDGFFVASAGLTSITRAVLGNIPLIGSYFVSGSMDEAILGAWKVYMDAPQRAEGDGLEVKLYEVSYQAAGATVNGERDALYLEFSATSHKTGSPIGRVSTLVSTDYEPLIWLAAQCKSYEGCLDNG